VSSKRTVNKVRVADIIPKDSVRLRSEKLKGHWYNYPALYYKIGTHQQLLLQNAQAFHWPLLFLPKL
jgi:hypothetical protein